MAFKTECPICRQILRKPHEATCCGKVFCYTCISRAKENSPRCPACQGEKYQLYYSKNVEQSLKELNVRCENYEDGCKWTGELGQYDSHLNLNSQWDKRIDGCQHAKIECHNRCGEAIQRHHILLHEMEECSQKQDDHTELEKSLYAYIQKLMHEISQKDAEIAELKSKFYTSKKEAYPITSDPDESATVVPVQRIITNFTERQEFVSEPFYTHSGGYKMCLWVFPNGYGDAENKYLSLFTCFMQGENDAELKWPFRGNITVQLVDQVHNRDHRERVISYDDANFSYAQRLTFGYKSKGWGQPDMIPLESIRKETCPFLKDDCLKIRITKVDFDIPK